MTGIDDPVDLLKEWFLWWNNDDNAPAKMPDNLAVRTVVAIAIIEGEREKKK